MKWLLLFSFFLSSSSFALTLIDDQDEYLDECEKLVEKIKESKCGKETLDFLKNAYVKLGLNVAQRTIRFEHKHNQESVFNMKGELSPSPILTLSLGDNYFGDSNFGYQLGGEYFSDTAYEQEIKRGDETVTVDLLTYSKATILSFTPSLFYTFGRHDNTPHTQFTLGLGLNAGYSKVKGTAYLTENALNTTCYDTGTNYLNGTATKTELTSSCEFGAYESEDFATGINLYLDYEYHYWIFSLQSGIYTQELKGEYTFSTYDVSFSLARKFGF